MQRFRGRLLNIHPSLCPPTAACAPHSGVLADGGREHGASVHFIVPELDAGAVICTNRGTGGAGDSAESLAARVLRAEHPLLVAVLRLAVSGRISEQGATVLLDGHPLFTPLHLDSAGVPVRSDP